MAMHEAIADLVALLSVFSTQTLVAQLLTSAGGEPLNLDALDEDLLRSDLFRLGDGLFKHDGMRRALAEGIPTDWRTLHDPHARGGAIVQVLLRVVARLWLARLDSPGGRSGLYQVARAGASVGRQVVSTLIRSLGYMAPVDVTWEDLLRGILAADSAVVHDDYLDYRGVVLTAFAEGGRLRFAALKPILDVDRQHAKLADQALTAEKADAATPARATPKVTAPKVTAPSADSTRLPRPTFHP
jgi:hypothetical protein